MADALANQPVVVDLGSGVLKAGFAGNPRPSLVIRNCVGRVKHKRMMPGGALENTDVLIGTPLERHRGVLRLSYPMEHGVVQDWQDMERLWQHIYTREALNCASEEHAVLLTEAPLNPHPHRERAAEILFQSFNVPALYVAPQAVLSLYASGRTTGVVLDSGDGVTHAVPVYEGFPLAHAVTRMDVAGRDVTRYLRLLLRRTGYNLDTSAELEVVRQMKEEVCHVAFSPNKEETYTMQQPRRYVLPDGSDVQVGPEAFRAPEVLFTPELIGSEAGGIADCLVNSIMRADLDLRRTLFAQIVLAGGSTLFPGFGDRLLNDVRKHRLSPKDTKIRIGAPHERLFSTWIGGSILASLAAFKTMWISRQEYDEEGARVLIERGL